MVDFLKTREQFLLYSVSPKSGLGYEITYTTIGQVDQHGGETGNAEDVRGP